MPITWSTFTLPDGRTHPQIEICEAADWDVVGVYAVGGAEPDAASVALLQRAHVVLAG